MKMQGEVESVQENTTSGESLEKNTISGKWLRENITSGESLEENKISGELLRENITSRRLLGRKHNIGGSVTSKQQYDDVWGILYTSSMRAHSL
jgi:hypothetical protein